MGCTGRPPPSLLQVRGNFGVRLRGDISAAMSVTSEYEARGFELFRIALAAARSAPLANCDGAGNQTLAATGEPANSGTTSSSATLRNRELP